jgi:hypothetical protein
MSPRNWAALAGVVAVAAAGASTATGAPSPNFYGVCGKLSAKGKTYQVRTVNVPCRTARGMVMKIANMPDPGANRPFPGRYNGMGCMHLVRGGSSLFCTSVSPFRQVVAVLKR